MARDWIRPKFICDPTYVHENVRMVTVLCDLADMNVADVQAHVKKGRKLLTRALRPFPQLWVCGAFDFEVVNTDLVLVQKGAPKNARLVDDLLQGEIVEEHRKILVHMHLLVDLNGLDGDVFRSRLASVFNVSRYQVDVSRLDRIDRSVKNYTGDDLFEANIRRIGNYMVKRTVKYKFKIKDHFRHKEGDHFEDDALSVLVTCYSSLGGSGYKSILINSKPR